MSQISCSVSNEREEVSNEVNPHRSLLCILIAQSKPFPNSLFHWNVENAFLSFLSPVCGYPSCSNQFKRTDCKMNEMATLFRKEKKQSNKIKPGKSYNTCRYFSPAWRSLFVLSVHHVNTCAWFIKRWLGFRCIAVNQRVCSHHYSISEHLGWYEHKWTALSMSDYAWHYASPRASQVSTCDPDLSSSLCMQIITYCTLIHFVKFIVWHLLNLQGDRNN